MLKSAVDPNAGRLDLDLLVEDKDVVRAILGINVFIVVAGDVCRVAELQRKELADLACVVGLELVDVSEDRVGPGV